MALKQLIYILFLAIFTSCGINSNIMFRNPKGKKAVYDSIPMQPTAEYRIAKDDKLTIQIFTNNGQGLIDIAGTQEKTNGGSFTEYLVRTDGTVEFPKIGKVKISGLTLEECQDTLKKYYSKEYIEPLIQLKVTNQRVIIFPGGGSDAKVVYLTNSNTTILEAIAMAGGINQRGRAYQIKLMRSENNVRKVYKIDLSKEENLRFTDLIVQANDYIYVEPEPRAFREGINIAAPIISLATSILLVFTLFKN